MTMEDRYSPESSFKTIPAVTPTEAMAVNFDHGQVGNVAYNQDRDPADFLATGRRMDI